MNHYSIPSHHDPPPGQHTDRAVAFPQADVVSPHLGRSLMSNPRLSTRTLISPRLIHLQQSTLSTSSSIISLAPHPEPGNITLDVTSHTQPAS